MQLTDLNAQGGIGANCLMLQLDSLTIVVDAGLHPRETGAVALPKLERLRATPPDIIFLTHCHLDHLGSLPVLAKDHPNTPIITSRDSAGFYKRMLKNSHSVMERQRAELGIPEYPLYSHRDISALNRQVIGVLPGMPRHFDTLSGERVTFTLFEAGHVPGAVGLLLEHHHRRIFHTADVLFADTALLDGARFPGGDMDTVILETTRGATERQAGRADEMRRLIETIAHTIAHGGSVLIPVFALGRMQELLAVLHHARAERALPRFPIYVSGLAVELLGEFDALAHHNKGLHARRKMLRELGAEKLPGRHQPGRERPSLYLLSSGMLVENTPSYMAAAALLGGHQNTICFVGYCDPDTPGGKLLKVRQGEKFLFRALGKTVQALARIERFDLSSHADRDELLGYAMDRHPRAVVLTHGDANARAWFGSRIAEIDPKCKVVDPVPLRTVTV